MKKDNLRQWSELTRAKLIAARKHRKYRAKGIAGWLTRRGRTQLQQFRSRKPKRSERVKEVKVEVIQPAQENQRPDLWLTSRKNDDGFEPLS